MDPAEVKEADVTAETSALPVVRDWKRISIACGASFTALVLVFRFLFGNRVTPAIRLFRRKAGVVEPSSIDELDRAIRLTRPRNRRNSVDHKESVQRWRHA
jgi:hypothetical protein